MDFDLKIEGDTDLGQALAAVIQAVSDQHLRLAAEQLRAAVSVQFLTEGRAYETPWLARRTRGHPISGAPLLFRSGRLYRSLVEPGGEHIEELSDRELLFGTRVPYAAFHQWGTAHLPARPMLTPEMLGGEAALSF